MYHPYSGKYNIYEKVGIGTIVLYLFEFGSPEVGKARYSETMVAYAMYINEGLYMTNGNKTRK